MKKKAKKAKPIQNVAQWPVDGAGMPLFTVYTFSTLTGCGRERLSIGLAGEIPKGKDARGKELFDIRQLYQAVSKSRGMDDEKLRKTKAEADLLEQEYRVKSGDLIPSDEVANYNENIFVVVREHIVASSLSDLEKDKILTDLCELKNRDFTSKNNP